MQIGAWVGVVVGCFSLLVMVSGGYFLVRNVRTKTSMDLQDKVNTLHEQINEALEKRLQQVIGEFDHCREELADARERLGELERTTVKKRR